MENKAHALAAGSFVLLLAVLATLMGLWLSRDTQERYAYELSTADSVSGLSEQAAVRFRGIEVGKVSKISFDGRTRGNVLIRITVDDRAPITSSTFATLSMQGVTGLLFVDLDDSGQAKEPLKTNNASPTRIPLKSSLLTKLANQGDAILNQVDATIKKVNTLLSDDNQRVMVGAVQNIGQVAASVDKLSNNLDASVTRYVNPMLASIPPVVAGAAQTLKTVDSATAEVGKLVQQVGAPGGVLDKVVAKGGLADKLSESVDAVNDTLSTVNASTLPRAARLADDSARAVRSVNRAVSGLGDNPQSLIFGNGPTAPGPGEPGFAPPAARAQP
jgi:phospholipid/cholesterol/gamma-HCH transport system substrate-binding protein